MGELSVTDAMLQRGAVREYSDQPVSAELMSEILKLAANSPSGGNVQPWKVYALAGDDKNALSQAVLEKAAQSNQGALIFAYQVKDPERYGVVSFDDDGIRHGDHLPDVIRRTDPKTDGDRQIRHPPQPLESGG